MRKKVVLIVIDALSSWVVRPALEQGRLPNFARFIEHGQVHWDCTSVMPSITPAATASIGTGNYPCDHGVMGAYFYDRHTDRVFYFSDDILAILNKRFRNYFHQFLSSLNHKLLEQQTVFEQLEGAGLSTASLNYLIYRGEVAHRATVPRLLSLWPGVPRHVQLEGPEILCLGDFVAHRLEQGQSSRTFSARGGIFHRYGFDDVATAQYLHQLADHGLPDFTLAYFPDNDFASHEIGPANALGTVEKVDQFLGELGGKWRGVGRMLDEVDFIVTGDHSQSRTAKDAAGAGIDLQQVLGGYQLAEAGQPWQIGDQLMVCPNLRVAQVYLRDGANLSHEDVVGQLVTERRVDQVIIRQAAGNETMNTFRVVTSDRGQLDFGRGGEADSRVVDEFGNYWNMQGDMRSIDAFVDDQNRIVYGDYPNALERIATSFDDGRTGSLWVTARLGYEFQLPRTGIHQRGGSHGSLHRLDSTVPFILSASSATHPLGDHLRTIDIAPWCAQLCGQPPLRPPGVGRFAAGPEHVS